MNAGRRDRWSAKPALLSVAMLVLAAPLGAQEPRALQDAVDRDAAKKPVNYGRTPDTAIPYRNFREPYLRFFQTVMPFRGAQTEPRAQANGSIPPRTLRIGYFGPTESAPDADLGQQMLEGVRLAVEQANTADGYQGIPFELIEREDLGLWGSSSNEMVAFKYVDDVLAVIGSIDGANTHIALRVALKIQMPMINTATTDPTLTETNIPWMLRCMADDRQQGYALAYYIFQERGIKKVAAFRANDRYGRTGIAEFRDAARRLKAPLRAELRWDPGDRDFTVQLDRIAETGAEAVVLWGNAADTAAVVKEIRRRQMPIQIFGCDRLANRSFLAKAGPAAEGVVAVATIDPTRDDPIYKRFVEAFAARFGHEPGTFAAHAYDGANILISAIHKAGPNRVRIRDALSEFEHFDGVTGPIRFDTTLNDIGPVYLATVQDGAFVYREIDFTSTRQASRTTVPYRRLADAPPAARSPKSDTDGSADVPAEYRIGCFLPLDDAGQEVLRGARLALADDAAQHPDAPPIQLFSRDARGAWGDASNLLVELVFDKEVIAVVATERRGTHLAEMLAAKFHFPVVTLCDADPTVTQIPLSWIFRVAPGPSMDSDFADRYARHYGSKATARAALGYDAAALMAMRIRGGAHGRRALRDGLAGSTWFQGVSGTFRFDTLGNRIERPPEDCSTADRQASRVGAAHRRELGKRSTVER